MWKSTNINAAKYIEIISYVNRLEIEDKILQLDGIIYVFRML